MPKQVYHIKSFDGGINKKADPRDIENDELVEVTNASVSNVGRITMSGDGKSAFATVNAKNVLVSPTSSIENQNHHSNETPIASGHGLFSFMHDYSFDNTNDDTEPQEITTEFICINDGADIDVWTDIDDGQYGHWKSNLISMGSVHNTGTDGTSENLLDVKVVKPVYYKADNGLRVCDGNFSEELTAQTTNEVVDEENEVSINVTGTGTNFIVGEYIRINSEVMKVNTTGASSISVIRARFSTKTEKHANGDNIYRINVPKIFTHIKRPMLKKTGANTSINRWVQDIQVPEAPEYDALTVFKSNIIGYDGSNILNGSLYPAKPERVNLGVSLNTVETNSTLRFHVGDTVSSDTTSTQTVVTITLASEADNTTEVDVTNATYNFAIGKFISIDGATGEGAALNGVHEIVGFGDGTGEVKIAADLDTVGYTQTGDEVVILEDELIDDNLKNRYIFGMSFLYDGGGSTLQESRVTTGLTSNAPNLIGLDSTFPGVATSGARWRTIAGSGDNMTGSPSDLAKGSTTNSFEFKNPGTVISNSNRDWIFYEADTDVVDTSTEYYISGSLTYTNKGETTEDIKIYVGIGPDEPTAAGTSLTVSAPSSSFSGLIEFSGTATSHSSVDASVPVAIQVRNAAGGGGELVTLHSISVTKKNLEIMSADNSFDFRQVKDVAKSYLMFLCNNSKSGNFNDITPNNSWNERIEGFRIYMKQVDIIGGGLADEWTMLYDVDLKEGTYIMHAKDSDLEQLTLGNINTHAWNATSTIDQRALVTTNVKGDSIKTPPLITYESENGYKFDTNLAARYKCATVVDRKVYIGNLKIGDKTFPDRMLRSDTDKFDTFPDDGTHFIDVATSDGESIIALESVGDKLIQYKEKTAYVIKVTSEGEELVATFSGAGVKNSCQIAKSSDGIYWVNSNGIYYYDGEKLSNVSKDKFNINNWITSEDFKKPVIVGYDKHSNKIIILTTNALGAESSGYIYDINNGAITQHDNLFNWYALSNPSDVIIGNTESEL